MKLGPKLIKASVSVALLAVVVATNDLSAVLDRLRNVDVGDVLAALAIIIAAAIPHALRWRLMLSACESSLPLRRIFKYLFIGYFFNQTLPSSLGGDAVRVWKGYRAGLTLANSFNSVLLDRLAALLALLVLISALIPWMPEVVHDERAIWSLILLVVAGVFGFAILCTLDRFGLRHAHIRLIRILVRLSGHARRAFLDWRTGPAAVALSIVVHAAVACTVYLLAVGLRIQVDLLDCLILVPPVILLTTIPISIAGWGVREGAMVVAFAYAGVPASDALALSLFFGFVLLLSGIPGGFVWMADDHVKSRAVVELQHLRTLPPDTD